MLFVRPDKTLSISLTGQSCALNCKHCGRHFLKGMSDVAALDDTTMLGKKSFLLSGGLEDNLRVPWEAHSEKLLSIKHRFGVRYNVHTGPIVGRRSLELLAELADVVSYDVVGNPATMREVYGINAWRESVETLDILFRSGIKTVPHLTIGLAGGAMMHEKDAIELITDTGFEEVVFLVLMPTTGTLYENASLPTLEEIRDLFQSVRLKKTLGCMIPKGKYRYELQKAAVDSGFSAIVKPVRQIEELFISEDTENNSTANECCSFYY